MDPIIGGALIGAGANLLGGLFGRKSSQSQQDLNIKMQKEFAQQGVQWKVADAKKAGIHPLYALGANTVSYNPIAVQDSVGPALAAAGQDVSRAMYATANAEERSLAKVNATLQTENLGLQNDLLRAQIAKLVGQVGPPWPNPSAGAATGAFEIKPAEITATRPNAPHITAGPASAAYSEVDFGPFKANMLTPTLSDQLEDMEAMKYWLLYKGNEQQVDDYLLKKAEPTFEYIWQKQKAIEQAAQDLNDWANSQRNRLYNARNRGFNQKRGSWGREAR